MARQNVVKLTATGLRTLIREEAKRVRSRRALHEISIEDIDWESAEGKHLDDAIETLTGTVLDMIYGENISDHDGAHPEVHNDILACVEKIFSEYGYPPDSDDAFTDLGTKGDGSYSR